MRLHSLRLQNFQGIKNAQFDFYGASADIYGDNATGKTTIFNAFTWLLFDKASTGVKNYSPKTTGPNGELHHLNHSAEAVLQLNTGRQLTLKKDMHEVYTKKRGALEEQYTGNTVEYFVDGVPVKEKEYINTINSICGQDPERAKILTIPNYFPEMMGWEMRRALLLDMCGDVSDEEIISGNEELNDLKQFLLMPGTTNQWYTVEEYRKIAAARRAKINSELEGIPGRIDEAERAIPDTGGFDESALTAKIGELREQRNQKQTECSSALESHLDGTGNRRLISEAHTRLSEARSAHAQQAASLNEGTNLLISKTENSRQECQAKANSLELDIDRCRKEIVSIQTQRQLLLDTYAEIQAQQFNDEDILCPTCGRELPAEKVAGMREEFNLKKSKQLEDINRRGQQEASQQMIDDRQAKLEQYALELNEVNLELAALISEIEKYRAQLQAPAPFESTEKYKCIIQEIEALQKGEIDNDAAVQQIKEQYDIILQNMNREIIEVEEKISTLRFSATQKERIQELQNREVELAREFEQTELGIHLCEQFVMHKVQALDQRINRNFKSVRFRLFQTQINGGLKDDCEVLVPAEDGSMVPYSFANNAARINAGLEIIEALSNHWDIYMPLFVDNAESVTRLLPINAQIIRLIVSEKDAALRLDQQPASVTA